MLALLKALQPGSAAPYLSPALQAAMFSDQLPPGRRVNFPNMAIPDLGFGLGGAIARSAGYLQHAAAVGDFQWGGLAGTHWWIHPKRGYAGVLMTQRFMGYWNPFWYQYRHALYSAIEAADAA